ncbi:unnamed protein product, partial [Ixodes hexagonus]
PTSTASKNWARLRRYAVYLERQCPGLPTAKEIYSQLKDMSSQFRDDFFAVCTESRTQPCQLLDKFDSWNRFFQEINMELSEKEPGEFGLRFNRVWNKRQGKGRSYLLLHWLLKQHCCIRTLWIVESLPPEHLHLFCDALQLNRGLKELVLRCDLDDKAFKDIIPAIGATLTSLVKLHISAFIIPQCALGSLGSALQRAPGLASLNLRGIPMDAHNAELLLSGFAVCPSLVELSVDNYVLLPREGAALAEFVAQSTVLKKLSLACVSCLEGVVKQLQSFLKGLVSNCSLEELHVNGFDLGNPAKELLVEAVAHHSTLKVLEVSFCDDEMDGDFLAELMAHNTGLRELFFGTGRAGSVPAFAKAIRKNTRLQKLQLTLIGMEVQNYRELLMALACNQSLRELEFDYVLDTFLGDLCELMQETGTEGRVKFQADFEDALVFTTAVRKCSKLTQMAYLPGRDGPPLPHDAFSELIHYHQLRKLAVYESHRPIDSECLVDLALFLSQTTTLKDADFFFHTTAGSTRVLLDAISQNKSLTKLGISYWTFEPSDVHELYDIIRSKKDLSYLQLGLSNCREHRLMHSLAEHLCSSLSLLSVTVEVDRRYDSFTAQERIRAATQRNSSTLHRAVKFVMGSRGRRFAEAFEKVFDLASLVETVQKCANETEEHAKEMVKRSKRYIDCNFLAAVGVVKDTVVCEPNGHVQLDCIGLDNWLQIRQYLKVADIKPDPVIGCYRPSLNRKRSRLN